MGEREPAPPLAATDALTLLASLRADPATTSFEELVRPLLRLIAELSGLEAVYLTRIDWDGEVQHIEVARNGDETFAVPEGLAVPWHDTLCELSLEAGGGWNTDVAGTWGDRPPVREFGIASYVAVPVQLADASRPYGTLCGASPRTMDGDPRVVEVLELVASLISAALERDRALRRAAARAAYAEKRLAGRIAFAAQVEHAMRTPLTVMLGWVAMLQRNDDAELRATGLAALDETTRRLNAQVGDLLVEARAAIGSGEVEEVDVGALARSLRGVVGDHPYEVVGELTVTADPIAVAVLVEHLVENAVAHTPDGTPIRVVMAPGTLVVEDDGPGLPEGRDDLLEPFVSADPDVRGTGLGLHIVASIVDRAGWGLELGASASGGARFTVSLAPT